MTKQSIKAPGPLVWRRRISEMASRGAKLTKISASGVNFLVYIEVFYLLSVQLQFGVIWCISDFRRPCILKTADRRAKPTKIWASGASNEFIQGTFGCKCSSEMDQNLGLRGKYLLYIEYFWLLSIQVQFGVIWCISDFDDLVSWKWLVVEWNGPNSGVSI